MDWDNIDQEGASALSKDGERMTRVKMGEAFDISKMDMDDVQIDKERGVVEYTMTTLNPSERRAIRQIIRSSAHENHKDKMERKKRERSTRRLDVEVDLNYLAFEADHKLQARFRAKRR